MKKISSYISYIILKKSKINTLLDKKNLIINEVPPMYGHLKW